MRFIHIADVHLGAVPDKDKSWSKERADEIESTFDRLLTVAEERKVELLLIAGDLFHAPPSLQELKSLDYKLSMRRRWCAACVPTFRFTWSTRDGRRFAACAIRWR